MGRCRPLFGDLHDRSAHYRLRLRRRQRCRNPEVGKRKGYSWVTPDGKGTCPEEILFRNIVAAKLCKFRAGQMFAREFPFVYSHPKNSCNLFVVSLL